MSDLPALLGALTLGGSAAIGALAVLARSTRARYGARWRCWAWLLLCLRLALPIPLSPRTGEGDYAPIRLPAPPDPVIYSRPAPAQGGGGAGESQPPEGLGPGELGTPLPAPGQAAVPDSSDSPQAPSDPGAAAEPREERAFSLSLSQLAAAVWLAGAALIAAWALLAHLRFLRYLRRWAVPAAGPETVEAYNRLGDRLKLDRRPRLLACPGLEAPMLAGLFRPVLLLPEGGLSGERLEYSLLHELIHFRRRDIWLKALALWVSALHWFNPAVWYMVRLVERDAELACDEAALKQLSPEKHGAYSRAILAAAERQK